ncbi:MAG: phosphotransferase [Chloroflexi bacterium]|nr:phosphotransferase [Chloroflexota bacterium]
MGASGHMAPDVAALLAEHGITAPEAVIAHNGFSGARISRLEHGGATYFLKRMRFEDDWIMRGLDDRTCREAEFAASSIPGRLPAHVRVPYLGAARDGDGWAVLSRDLSHWVFAQDGVEQAETWGAILGALAEMHAAFLAEPLADAGIGWCPWRERITFLSPSSTESLAREGIDFGAPEGWRAFRRVTEQRVQSVIFGLLADPGPLLRVMAQLPATLVHADAKIANMGLEGGTLWLFDWADVTVAPVGLEIGHLLAVNSSRLPWEHDDTLCRYAAHLERCLGSARFSEIGWPRQVAIAALSGFMVLGWAKAREAEAGAREEFEWWCAEAVRAADLLGL